MSVIYLKKFKLKKEIPKTYLAKINAKIISEVSCEDRYFSNDRSNLSYTKLRTEKDNDEKILSKKQIELQKELFIEKTHTKITTKEILETEIAHVHKIRTTAIVGSVIIHIDKIEDFGNYVEFLVMHKKNISEIETVVSLFKNYLITPALKKNYLELFTKQQNKKAILFHKISETIGKFAFGIFGGVLTTLGVMIGLLSATSSKLAVIGGIVSVSVVDSLSDSVSMYSSKRAEKNTTKRAFFSALFVFFGKFVFSLTFILAFLFFSFKTAIYVNLFWGLLVIVFLNLVIAEIQNENKVLAVLKNTLIVVIVILLSYLIGTLTKLLFSF